MAEGTGAPLLSVDGGGVLGDVEAMDTLENYDSTGGKCFVGEAVLAK